MSPDDIRALVDMEGPEGQRFPAYMPVFSDEIQQAGITSEQVQRAAEELARRMGLKIDEGDSST